jgi:flavin prenyltransferase
MPHRKIVIAIAGSSGSVYAERLLTKLSIIPDITVGVVMSTNAVVNWELELGAFDRAAYPNVKFYEKHDFMAPFASGSAQYDTMIVCPASMGIIGRIATGVSDDLITRAADVVLKERRKLIIVPRETPYNLIHLRNMTTLTESGGIICPASPSFYSHPETISEVIDTVVDRILALADLASPSYQWGE